MPAGDHEAAGRGRRRAMRATGALALFGAAGLAWALSPSTEGSGTQRSARPAAATPTASSSAGPLRVQVARPTSGGLPRMVVQPGSVHAFESVDLYAKASGFLGTQEVDIGDRIAEGQVLATIDAPELVEDVQTAEAAVAQMEAKVDLADANTAAARLELRAADAAIVQARAEVERAKAGRILAEKRLARIEDLAERDAVSIKLVDEQQHELQAAVADEHSREAAVATAEAHRAQAEAGVLQAEAAAADARAAVRVAESKLDRTRIFAGYAEIRAPFDGVVTRRHLFPGDFIRSAADGAPKPILTVQRTDLMRVVVPVPDDVSVLLDVGDRATLAVDSLEGAEFEGQVSRYSHSQDPATRTMRTEVDVPNPDGRLHDGMFGRVSIELESPSRGVTIPSTSVLRGHGGGDASVFVARGDVARLVPIEVGPQDGSHLEVISGLSPDDLVILHPDASLKDGAPVLVTDTQAVAGAAAH